MTPHNPSPTRLLQTESRSKAGHVLIATVGSVGDMHPMLSMGVALQRQGHAVRFAANPVHAARVQACGLDYRAMGTRADFEATADDPALWNPRTAMPVFWRGLRSSLQQLPEAAQALPTDQSATLLVHPLLLPAAALARASRPGLRVVAAWLAPQNLRTCHDPMMVGPLRIPPWLPMPLRRLLWRHIDRRFIDPAPLPELNDARRALGLPPVPSFFPHLQTVADQSITLFPEWFAHSAPDWPQRMLRGTFPLFEPPGSADLPAEAHAFLSAGAAPVVVTLGTFQRHSGAMLTQVVQAVRALGRRIVVLAADREQLALPPAADLLWQPYLPLHHLLPRSAALVHHGGIGTTAEALRAAVPQLVLPWAFDQFDNAQRVRALGVGETLPSRRIQHGEMQRVLGQLLNSGTVAGACKTAAALQSADPTVDELCRQLMCASDD
jgi:rhamnosyltransferase subunit B